MNLTIEIMDGKRKGEFIRLTKPSEKEQNNSLPYILETEALTLHLETKSEKTTFNLLMNGKQDEFSYNFYDKETSLHHHILRPKKINEKKHESLFFNYFGIADFDIQISTPHNTETLSFSNVNILATKITAEQSIHMIEYILNHSDEELYKYFSATRSKNGLSKGDSKTKDTITKLTKTIEKIEKIIPSIIKKPLTKITREERMRNGSQVQEINEQGLAWLNENLSLLEETDDIETSHLLHKGVYYTAKKIQSPIIIECTDIYENHVIHSFLVWLKKTSEEIEKYILKNHRPAEPTQEEGYISFFSTKNTLLKKSRQMELNRIKKCRKKISNLIHVFNSKILTSTINKNQPIFTPKIKSSIPYTSMFRIITEWYKFNKINWLSQEVLLAIKNIPELFEYYSVLKTKSSLESFCKNIEEKNNHDFFLKGSYRHHEIKLHYQPTYWMVGHKNAINSHHIRTEISQDSFHRTKAVNGFMPSNNKNSKRVPDIVIELSSPTGNNILLILDAKYSKMKTAFKYYLHACGMKYIHGIHGIKGDSPVTAMILICPTQNKEVLADMHAPPYGVFDESTVFPMLGVQGINLTNETMNSNESLNDTIKKMLDLVIDKNTSH